MIALNPKVHGAPVLLRHLPEGPLVGAEVGVLRGVNAAALLQARPELLLYCVDNWQHGGLVKESPAEIRRQAHGRLMATSDSYGTQAHPWQYVGDRVIWQEMASHAAADHHSPQSLDFVYIDGDHSYLATSLDISFWRPLVKPGGILAGHDYGHDLFPGVKEAVDAMGWDDLIVEEFSWIHRVT